MSVSLTPQTESMIEEMLATGHFVDAGDVIEQAVRLLEERERRRRLRASVSEDFAAIRRGEGIELTDEVWQAIERDADESDRKGLPLDPDVSP
jgi:antitoxin ParD1/3/4